ncbi:MAG: hypothetical protein JST92_23990 [Deltaproteobacteria bacterium]|nr:hypothetical protein [Deltaproteobacteria bacterium]
MAKMRMGDLLMRAGLITESDLRVALAQQKQHGGKLGEHLVRVNVLTEETLARALAQQLGITYNDMSSPPSASIAQIVPEKIAARVQALPTAFDPRTGVLTVAVSDPLDEGPLMEVAKYTGKQVMPEVTPANLLRRAIEHAYFGVDVKDEGTSEFQLVDIHGRGKTVRVHDDHELPELNTSELMPLEDDQLDELSPLQMLPDPSPAPPPPVARPSSGSMRIPPPVVQGKPVPPRPAPPPPVASTNESGDEALRTVWAIADLLIERGYFTRAELMKTLRSK